LLLCCDIFFVLFPPQTPFSVLSFLCLTIAKEAKLRAMSRSTGETGGGRYSERDWSRSQVTREAASCVFCWWPTTVGRNLFIIKRYWDRINCVLFRWCTVESAYSSTYSD
jgi:hypothetical protein